MFTIGVDPGLNGAIAIVRDGIQLIDLMDMPTVSNGRGTKVSRSVDGAAIASFLSEFIGQHPMDYIGVVVEKTASMPGQGLASTYSMGHSRGIVEGVVQAKRLPLHLVAPAAWKRVMGLTSDKELVRGEMLRQFPSAPITRKKDHDRAEAIALALYLYKEKFK